MLFSYKAVDKAGAPREGTVDAQNIESAIETVETRGYTIVSLDPINKAKNSFLDVEITWFDRVSNKDVVILSRQIATLFEAQVSALRIFRLLGTEIENPKLQQILNDVSNDLQGGSSISRALARHPDVFSEFYVSMVKAGEESGTLEKTFMYLADYLDRMYQVVSKARNALIYPAFVISIFIGVMMLMLTLVIPNISAILLDSGQEIPVYTKIVIGLSSFLTNYIGLILVFITLMGVVYWQFQKTEAGKRTVDEFKLAIPFIGSLYQKLFLTRICDNLATMLTSGISMVQALEVTAEVVDNRVYKEIIESTLINVKGGRSFADSIAEYPEIPGVLAQMSKVGEETGKLGDILSTLAVFYQREVNNAVDTLISLIEPAMIVLLGLGVGVLLASVLIPIYNITGAI
ncbi:MAG: type II secretion system F family protein [Candidatus Pacebacteria bacterium]|nr:type II secretion system F family protein [Candidatus Paceibacterota bacterium]MCF7857491.1 type II secretion system F family protein [Candidatus Paceibacterota bacterium]